MDRSASTPPAPSNPTNPSGASGASGASDAHHDHGVDLRLRLARAARRRPNGRAIIGGLLIAIAGLLAFTTAADAGSSSGYSVVVAARPIAIGQRLTGSDLALRRIALDDTRALWSSPEELIGSIAIAPIGTGEFIQSSAISDDGTTDGAPVVTIAVERDHAVGGDLRPGEFVDVLATHGSGNDAVTVVIAHGARVMRLEELKGSAIGSSGRFLVTLSMADSDQILDATHASNVATITLVRTTGVDATPSARNSTTGPLARSTGAR